MCTCDNILDMLLLLLLLYFLFCCLILGLMRGRQGEALRSVAACGRVDGARRPRLRVHGRCAQLRLPRHVDAYDIDYQWAVSFGEFVGGELCIESAPDEVSAVVTRNRQAKVDGRRPHWVAPWRGERYSVIVYKTRGEASPLGPSVHQTGVVSCCPIIDGESYLACRPPAAGH